MKLKKEQYFILLVVIILFAVFMWRVKGELKLPDKLEKKTGIIKIMPGSMVS